MPNKRKIDTIYEKRYEQLYFPDGDIVLSASNADSEDAGSDAVAAGITLFRVDKVYLFRNSPVFKDLLSPAQPSSNEMYDGVLRVHMPDNARDLARLICALYDSSSLKLEPMDPDLPLNIAGVLKLAHKYQVSRIYAAIRRALNEAWPQSLVLWDRQGVALRAMAKELENSQTGEAAVKYLNALFPEPASAIALALEYDMPELLPLAMYQLALIDPEDDWSSASDKHLRAGGRAARWDMVDRKQLLRVMRGRQKLIKLSKATFRLNHDVKCAKLYTCGLQKAVDLAFCQQGLDHLRRLKFLQDCLTGDERPYGDEPMVIYCRPSAAAQVQSRRELFWSGLSEFFEIGT